MFLPSLKAKSAVFEKEGNLPVEVKKLPLIIKRDGNKVDLRIVWWLLVVGAGEDDGEVTQHEHK